MSVSTHMQERHSQLLDDYARQLRVADIARTVQREAATASLRGIQVRHLPSSAGPCGMNVEYLQYCT